MTKKKVHRPRPLTRTQQIMLNDAQAILIMDLRGELAQNLYLIRGHAQAMAGTVAHINDKTGPIIANVDAMLTRLGAPIPGPYAARPTEDIGQGEGCEGGKCDLPNRR